MTPQKVLQNKQHDTPNTQPKRYQKHQLFGEAKEIIIRHGELDYRLRETRNGKLILNL